MTDRECDEWTPRVALIVGRALVPSCSVNLVSGIGYTWLKFDVLGHSAGTGVIPGPWLTVPLLSLVVIPAWRGGRARTAFA